MVHLHARTPDGAPSHEIEDFRAITEAIRAEVGDALIINYSTGTIGVPVEKRIAYLRELRPDIGALNMGSMNYAKYSSRRKRVRLQGRVRELVRHDRRAAGGDGRVRDPARARVLRLRPRGVARSAARHGRAEAAAAGLVRDGRDGRDPADGAQRRAHGRAGARRAAPVGRDRDLARAVGAAGGGAVAGRQRPRRARGQLLSAGRRDGALQRRPRRAGGADGDRRGAAARDRRRGARRCWGCERRLLRRRSATAATARRSGRAGRGTRATSTPGRRRRC